MLSHCVLKEWLNVSYLLATNIDKPNGDSIIKCPTLVGLSIAFLGKEFSKPQLTLSYSGCCPVGHSNMRHSAGVGRKYFHEQRRKTPIIFGASVSKWEHSTRQ